MRGPCSGACCVGFTSNATDEQIQSREGDEGRRIRQILLRVIATPGRYTCNEFDAETKRCRAYDARPMMCSRFPDARPMMCSRFPNSDRPCRQCGAATDQEARGVALMAARGDRWHH